MKHVGTMVVLGAVALAAGLQSASAADWPQWRGPERNGISAETDLLDAWPEGGPRLVWTASGAGGGFSSMAVAGGRLYTLGELEDDSEYLLAFDAADGKLLWKLRNGGDYDNDRGGGPRSTPTVDGDRIFVYGSLGDLRAATLDGKSVWHVPVLEKFGTGNLEWGLSESPLVVDGKVIVASGSPGGSIVAFDRKTGEVVWQSAGLTDQPGYASAIAATVGGVRQVVHFTSKAAVGVRLSDGKPMWRYTQVANDTANCATPAFRDDRVFFTSGYDTGGALLKLATSGGETAASEAYFTRDMQNHHGGVVVLDGHVYGFSDTNLTCLDLATGKVKWRDRSVGKGSLIAADGKLYLLSERNTVALAEANPAGYKEISRFSFEASSHHSWAHPVIANGRLYIRDRDAIRCYDVKAQ
jgi:outer membrane protein assembly factor BamB